MHQSIDTAAILFLIILQDLLKIVILYFNTIFGFCSIIVYLLTIFTVFNYLMLNIFCFTQFAIRIFTVSKLGRAYT